MLEYSSSHREIDTHNGKRYELCSSTVVHTESRGVALHGAVNGNPIFPAILLTTCRRGDKVHMAVV